MNYSCGYWKDAKNLEEAQQHKMELIGRKLKLKPGMRVLDIGCGWGGLCKYLAETYNVQVVGITNSTEGAKEAIDRCTGLSVEIRVLDYRDLNEGFDRIVSVGMFEHVGRQNYRTFFEIVDRCLSDDGIFLLHTIGIDNDYVPPTEPFTDKYIFANGILPDHKNIPEGIHNLFCIEDWHNFGQYYDKTLMAWLDNFIKNWPSISHLFKDQKHFYRLWTHYLSVGAGLFRARKFQLWQIILTKKGLPGGYISVR